MRPMPRLFAMLVAILCCGALAAAEGGFWQSPSGWEDPEGKWVEVPLAWDGSTASYAADQSNRAGNGPWLVFDYDQPIRTDRLLVNADFGFGIVDAVHLEARVGGAWTPLYSGAIGNCTDHIVTFPALTTDAIRFRFHYLTGGYYFWLYSFAAFALPAEVLAPQAATVAATSVTASTAALHGVIVSDGGEPCAYRFRYHPVGTAEWIETPWGGAAVSGQGGNSVLLPVVGLQSGVTYAFHIQARNSVGMATGTDSVFTPQPVPLGSTEWLTASDVTAETVGGMSWDVPVQALDDDTATAARCYHPLWAAQWGPYMQLALPEVEIDHVRLSAGANPYIDAVAVEVRATPSGAWTPLYQGAFTDRAWLVCPLPVRATYAQARVRFHVTTTGVGTNWELFEFQVRMPPLVSFAAGADTTLAQPGHVDLPLRLRPATSTLPITVNLAAGGTAQLGTDWQAGGVPGQLVIPAGAPAPSLDVEVLPGSGTGTQTASVTLVGADAGRIVDPVSATVTIVRGDGGGDPGQPPAAPVVTLAITGGLTGEQHATIDGVYTGLTRNTQITVAISAAITDGAALVGTQLVASAGTATQAGATWTLADLPEGQIDLSATATVRKNGQETTGTATQHLTLLVDRTVPSVLLCEPGSTDGSAPLGVGLIADGAAPLLLNQADDASALRTAPGWRCWSVASLAIPARISDPSGLSTVELPTVTVGAAPLTVTPASLDSATTLLTLTDFAGLPESVVPDESLVLGAGAGMQPLHLRVEDRCGNAFDADICSVWKKTTAGGARFGYVPRTTTGFATTIGVIPDNGPTDQAPAQLLATAADIVAVECQGTALRRLSASPTSWTGLGGATPVLWRLSPAIAADALDHLATTVTLRDLAGNRQEVVARATQTWFDAARPTASRQIMADPVTVPQQYAVRILRREMEFPYYAPNSSYAVLKTYLYDAVGEFAQPLVETRWQIRPVGWTLRENPLNGSRIGIEYERGDEASTIVRTSLAGGSGTLAGGLDAGLPQYATSSGHDGSSAISVNPEQDYDWGMMGSGWMEWYTTTPWHAITAPVSEPVYGLADARPVAGAADQPHLTGNLPVMDYQMLTWTNGEEGILASYMSGGMWLQWLQWMRALDRQSWTVAGDLDSVRDHWNSVEGALRCVTLPSSWSTPATVAYPVPATEGRWSGADGSSRVLTTTGDGLDLGLLHADTAGFARVQWLGTGTDGEPRRQQLGYRAIDAVGIPQDVIAIGAGLRCAIDGGFVAGLGTSATVTLPSGSAVTFGDAAARAAAELALRGLDASAFSVWCAGEATRLSGIVRGADSIPAWSTRVLLPARGLLAVAKAAVGAPDSIEQALRTADGAAPDQTLFRSAVDLDALTVAAAAAQTAEATWQAKLGTLWTQQSNGTAWAEAMVTAAVAAAGQAATTRATCLAQGQAAWAAYRQAVAAALQPYETELAACVAAMDEAEEQSLAYAATLTPWQLSQFVPTASGSATGWAEVNPEWAYAWFMAGMRRSEIISDPAYQTLLRAKQQADSDPLVSLDRTADPTLCDLYADRTWRDGDLALTGLLRVTGLSLTADAFSAPLRQTLMCELAPETAAVGVYDVLVTCGLVHAYPDELSQQYAGAYGAHRMKEALNILRIDYLVPSIPDDPDSEPVVAQWIMGSDPIPRISLTGSSNVIVSGTTAYVPISGAVEDCIADTMPRGTDADIQRVDVSLDGSPLTTAMVQAGSGGSPSFFRPHPYHGTFDAGQVRVPADGITHELEITAKNLWGNTGRISRRVTFFPQKIPQDGTSVNDGDPIVISIFLPETPVDQDLASAIYFIGERNPQQGDTVLTEVDRSDEVIRFSGTQGLVNVSLTIERPAGDSTSTVDRFNATLTCAYGDGMKTSLRLPFLETSTSSRLFRATEVLAGPSANSDVVGGGIAAEQWGVRVEDSIVQNSGYWNPVTTRVRGKIENIESLRFVLNGATKFQLESEAGEQDSYILRGGSTNIFSLKPVKPAPIVPDGKGQVEVEVVSYDVDTHSVQRDRLVNFDVINGRLTDPVKDPKGKNDIRRTVGYYHILTEPSTYWPTGSDQNKTKGKLLLGGRKPMQVYAATKNATSVGQGSANPALNMVAKPDEFSVEWKYKDVAAGFTKLLDKNGKKWEHLVYYDAPTDINSATHSGKAFLEPLPGVYDTPTWGNSDDFYMKMVTANMTVVADSATPPLQAFQAMNLTWPMSVHLENGGQITKPENGFKSYIDPNHPLPSNGGGGLVWQYTTNEIRSDSTPGSIGGDTRFMDYKSDYLLRCSNLQNDGTGIKPSPPMIYGIYDQHIDGISQSDPGYAIVNDFLSDNIGKPATKKRGLQLREETDWTGSVGLIPRYQYNVKMLNSFVNTPQFGEFEKTSKFVDNLVIRLDVSNWLRARDVAVASLKPPLEQRARNITYPISQQAIKFRDLDFLKKDANGDLVNGQTIVKFRHFWIIRVGIVGQESDRTADAGGEGCVIISNVFEARLRNYQNDTNSDRFQLECTYTATPIQGGGTSYADRGNIP